MYANLMYDLIYYNEYKYKERMFDFIIIMFIGMFVIYIIYTPPTIIVKCPNVDKIKNVSYIDSNK